MKLLIINLRRRVKFIIMKEKKKKVDNKIEENKEE